MVKIGHINSNNMRNDAYFQFHTEFRRAVEKFGVERLKITTLYKEYVKLYQTVDKALKRVPMCALTQKIHELNKERGRIWGGMVEMNKAARKHFDKGIKESARKLKILFNTYGNIARQPLNEQTAATHHILKELEGNYAKDAAAVGITEWAAELKTCNTKFDTVMKMRYAEGAKTFKVILRDVRNRMDVVYRSIIERINAMVVLEGLELYEPLVKTLKAIIASFSLNIGSKGKKRRPVEKRWKRFFLK